MRELVNESSFGLHGPELRGNRLAPGQRKGKAHPPRSALFAGKTAQKRGRTFARLPTLRIDRLVSVPRFVVETVEQPDLDFARLALERRADLARPTSQVFRVSSAADPQ